MEGASVISGQLSIMILNLSLEISEDEFFLYLWVSKVEFCKELGIEKLVEFWGFSRLKKCGKKEAWISNK